MLEPEKTTGYVNDDYLHKISVLAEPAKLSSYQHMHIQVGSQVLDIGCGPGIDTLKLGEWVGPEGKVYGVDYDADMVKLANQKAADRGLNQLKHLQSLSTDLPFADHSFDAVRSERLFQHLTSADALLTLQEMMRVTKPGGRLVVVDTDHSSFFPDLPLEVDWQFEWSWRNAFVNSILNANAGRKLPRLFQEAGLHVSHLEIHPVIMTNYAFFRFLTRADQIEKNGLAKGQLDPKALQSWHDKCQKLCEQGKFFSYGCLVLASAQIPFE